MHTVSYQCISHFSNSKYREKYVPTIPYFSKKMNRLIPLSTKVDPSKNPTSHKISIRNFYTVLVRRNIVTILNFNQFSQV